MKTLRIIDMKKKLTFNISEKTLENLNFFVKHNKKPRPLRNRYKKPIFFSKVFGVKISNDFSKVFQKTTRTKRLLKFFKPPLFII